MILEISKHDEAGTVVHLPGIEETAALDAEMHVVRAFVRHPEAVIGSPVGALHLVLLAHHEFAVRLERMGRKILRAAIAPVGPQPAIEAERLPSRNAVITYSVERHWRTSRSLYFCPHATTASLHRPDPGAKFPTGANS